MPRKYVKDEEYRKIARLLDAYNSASEPALKTKYKTLIVIQMMPVVKRIARAIARRATDPVEDLVQAGAIGLLKAIDHFVKEKNDNFRVYAGYLIIGEMKHYLRDRLDTIRVPRYIQELAVRINNFTNSLTLEELQVLTTHDVAFALNIPTPTIDLVLQADRRRNVMSLDGIYSLNNESTVLLSECIADKDYIEYAENYDLKMIFNSVIEQMDVQDKILIKMYYKQGMSQKEIAKAYGISQMSMSRRMKVVFEKFADLVVKKYSDVLIERNIIIDGLDSQ